MQSHHIFCLNSESFENQYRYVFVVVFDRITFGVDSEKKGWDEVCQIKNVKVKFSVESRNDMSEQQWTELSAQLKAAETAPQLFEALINKIRTIRVTHNGAE